MNEAASKLLYHRLARAREAFKDGELLLERGSLSSATNRFYYAAFYAARACLATRDVDSSRHSGVISLFHQHFVKPDMINVSKARALSRAFEKRRKSDYGDFAVLTREEVQVVRDETAAFVDECSALLEQLVRTQDESGQEPGRRR